MKVDQSTAAAGGPFIREIPTGNHEFPDPDRKLTSETHQRAPDQIPVNSIREPRNHRPPATSENPTE